MRKLLLGLGVAVLSQFAGPAWAVTVTSGVLEGDFSDVDYGANSSTAPATTFITNGASASTLQWGTGSVSYGTNYSTIEFIGATVPLEDTTEPVLLGSIVYLNGTSNTDSIISGATLTFSLGGVMLGHDQVIITSTTNLYSNMLDLTPAQAQNDADYVNVCGNGSNICSIGIQAFEDTEGFSGVPFSTPVVANLYGTYSIDPSITLTDATYVSGDGVVSGRPSGSVPEADLGDAAARFCGNWVYGAPMGSQNAISAHCLAATTPPGFRDVGALFLVDGRACSSPASRPRSENGAEA